MPKLEWKLEPQYKTWEAEVPAKDGCGEGKYKFSLIPRPHYCDRGRWLLIVSWEGIFGLDDQEGFPRYFFSLQRAQEEVQDWVDFRQEVKDAISQV